MVEIVEKSNYLAKIVNIDRLEPHPNADKLQLAIVDYQRVIVSLDTKIGDVVIYFPLECQINSDFLSFVNAFSNSEQNRDKDKKGFFDKKGRVKATRLRGVVSEGYIHPIESFNEFLQSKNLRYTVGDKDVGSELDHVGDFHVCWKYVAPVKISNGPNKDKKVKKLDRLVERQFRLHDDTENLKRNIDKISPDDIISITEKFHGSNAVLAKVLCKKKLKLYEKFLKLLRVNIVDTEYDYVCSSRRVVKNIEGEKDHNHFYDSDIWSQALHNNKDKIKEGISLYCELVGQTEAGSWIQKDYDYGTLPCRNKLIVFRITYTDHMGNVFEFTRPQIERYCAKYELEVAPCYYYGKAKGMYPELSTEAHWHENFLSNLQRDFNETDCALCRNKVPREGIVLAKECESFEAYKLKSIAFLERETKLLDTDTRTLDDE